MEAIIEPVTGRKARRRFIRLPARIHRGHVNWVPPLYMDDRKYFNPSRNRSFRYCDAVLFIARKGRHAEGRIMGIINNRYNGTHGERHARFAYLECPDDPEVAGALLGKVEDWARSKGMSHVIGPMGFSDKDPQGLLVEGFDEPMVLATNCNLPYLVELVENSGYTKKTDLVVYQVPVPEVIPEFYRKVSERTIAANNIRIGEPRRKKELKGLIRPVLDLVNQTFGGIYGFDTMSGEEMDELAGRFLSVLDPRFLKLVWDPEGRLAAFILAMPDISKGIVRSGGRLFPFGIIHILRAAKKTKQLNLLLGAVREDYRNSGLDAVLAVKTVEEARKAGMSFMDSHLELEDNLKVRAEMERFGGKVYKRFRIFSKQL